MRAQQVAAPCSQGPDRVASTSRAAQQTASRVLGAPDSRATAESRRAAARLLHNPPAAREVVNVREQGHRRRDHDEAVKMVNFSRVRKAVKCDLDKQTRKSLVPGSWLPGSRSEVRYGDAVREFLNSYKL